MMILQCLLFALSALFVGNVHVEEVNPPLTSISDDDEWFDGSMDTDKISCRGELLGRRMSVTICNMTTNAIVINRTIFGFQYAVKYRDSMNEVRFFESECPIEHHMGHLEVLSEQDTPEWPLVCDCRTSTDVVLIMPDGCKQIEQVAIQIEFVPLNKIGNYRTAGEFRELFLKNKFRKIVDFEENVGPGTSGGKQAHK